MPIKHLSKAGKQIFSIFIVVFIVGIVLILQSDRSKQKDVQTRYETSAEDIDQIVKYFQELPFDDAWQWKQDYPYNVIHVLSNGYVTEYSVEDPIFQDSLYSLFQTHKCSIIGKKYGFIYFQFWENLDRGWGLMYSENNLPTTIKTEYATYTISPIDAPYYYYYVSEAPDIS